MSHFRDLLHPIANVSNSAFGVYLGVDFCGVLWPKLTFNRRALVGDNCTHIAHKPAVLVDPGFEFKLYPWC